MLFDYQHSSPIIDDIISNNGKKNNVIPYCRTGYVIDYILKTKTVDCNINLLNDEAITSLINSKYHSILKPNDYVCGEYYTENYNRDGYITFRIGYVDTNKPWTIIRRIGEHKEFILYLDDKNISKFKCYSKSLNYYLPIQRCEQFQEYDKTNNRIDGSFVEWVRCKEITLKYEDGTMV